MEKTAPTEEMEETGVGEKGALLDQRGNPDVRFVKAKGSTMLRVGSHGNIRVMATAGKSAASRRYWFTFNGTECNSPTFIDGQFLAYHTLDIHRHSTIEGICENLAAGEVVIGFHVGQCRNYPLQMADAYTGWQSATRIIVEEF